MVLNSVIVVNSLQKDPHKHWLELTYFIEELSANNFPSKPPEKYGITKIIALCQLSLVNSFTVGTCQL